ncbi:MAG: hypothetical protein JW753_06235 [Dehalococcoidia bacterium]|nr:hypothetical protein [Dehalococcoidia bacterium]
MDRKGGCAIAVVGGGIGLCLMAAGTYAFLGAATLENYEQYPWIVALFILGLAIALTSFIIGAVKSEKKDESSPYSGHHICLNCSCRVPDVYRTCRQCGAKQD